MRYAFQKCVCECVWWTQQPSNELKPVITERHTLQQPVALSVNYKPLHTAKVLGSFRLSVSHTHTNMCEVEPINNSESKTPANWAYTQVYCTQVSVRVCFTTHINKSLDFLYVIKALTWYFHSGKLPFNFKSFFFVFILIFAIGVGDVESLWFTHE